MVIENTELEQHVTSYPTPQNALDIFKGEWTSQLPDQSWNAGHSQLFDDKRIQWAIANLGTISGKRVLELGPLEAAHTYMLEQAGAWVTAIESNRRAYLKCLIVKELLQLNRSRFYCGDFREYLRGTRDEFDVVFASGVLYHMRNPVELIRLLSDTADQLFIWTHYYDAEVIHAQPHLAPKFTGGIEAEYDGFRHKLYRQEYRDALNWSGFLGGTAESSAWMSRADILAALHHYGYHDLRIDFDHPDHCNGPALAIAAIRTPQPSSRWREAIHEMKRRVTPVLRVMPPISVTARGVYRACRLVSRPWLTERSI